MPDPAASLRERKKAQTKARIAQAALELFTVHGYDAVTMAAVAARAGVGERTVFRYFPDKSELLFGEDEALRLALAEALATRPPSEPPFTAVRAAALAVSAALEDRHAELRARRAVLEITPAFLARERAKQAAWERLLAADLARRGLEPGDARLAARTAVACYDEGLHRWLADEPPRAPLQVHVDEAFRALGTLVAGVDR